MKTTSRRQREFRQREEMFLDLARRMIADGGLVGFNMDRLAEATEYSKGTIYQHFASKEDLVTALAIQSLRRRTDWFERAARLAGRPREKAYALTVAEEVFVTLQPLHFRTELMIKVADFGDRASSERKIELEMLEERCIGVVRGVIEEAIRCGDLTLAKGRTPGEIVAGFTVLHIGTFIVMHSFPQLFKSAGIDDPFRALRNQVVAYMDGLNWQPLSTQSDPAAGFRRALLEVFPDESRQAGFAE